MKTIEESVLTAMDCTDSEILPYLPYILQDFWEIGSDPKVMINLIKKHLININKLTVLDLGCGKGVVSINIAKQMNCECYGIDAVPEFISFSASKADEYRVGNLCKFEVGDIREKVKTLGKYDVIILGAIGQVFGNYFETFTILNNNLKDGGIIIIDDGYIEDESSFKHESVFSKSELKKQISEAGMHLLDEVVASEDINVVMNYDIEYNNLLKRCQELNVKHPDKAELFINYSNQQKNEYNNLKNGITCSTMVVKRQDT
jgi:cyclopropane fatty-acyl-phospholipid synthase-like methyltransferase